MCADFSISPSRHRFLTRLPALLQRFPTPRSRPRYLRRLQVGLASVDPHPVVPPRPPCSSVAWRLGRDLCHPLHGGAIVPVRSGRHHSHPLLFSALGDGRRGAHAYGCHRHPSRVDHVQSRRAPRWRALWRRLLALRSAFITALLSNFSS